MFREIIVPILKIGWLTVKVYLLISVFFICFFFFQFTIGVATREAREPDTIVIPNGELAPVTFGNPFLPYRDVTPKVLTGSSWHTKGTEVDYCTPYGTPLYAPMVCPCVVTGKGIDKYNNTYIYFSSEDGVYDLLYMHGDYLVSPGDIIAPGMLIGTEASHGNSSEPHTHVEVVKHGVDIDPRKYNNTAIVSVPKSQVSYEGEVTGTYADIINKYAKQYDLDPKIVRGIIMQESGFDKNAVSYAGASGLMQLMPAAKSDQCPLANLFDPEQNIACGTKHLRWTIDQMGGDLKLGIMAYHSGVGNQRTRGATDTDLYYYNQVIKFSKE